MASTTQYSDTQSLHERLTAELPAGFEFHFHHVSTPPTKSDPLFAPPPGRKPDRTYCENQFLTVSITPPHDSGNRKTLVYAIEVLVYSTKYLTTIFVAKADSTGYLGRLGIPQSSRTSPLRSITSTFISWLVENRQRPGVRLVVSLFARAQNQYLFPGSVENTGKHVLDDRQLIRWWCRTLDPVMRRTPGKSTETNAVEEQTDKTTSQGYVIVPGFDKHETTSFFPPSWRSDPPRRRRWQYGHPFKEISRTPAAPPRCLVPHFPDDPKARFLDELDEEIPDAARSQAFSSPSKRGSGIWRSVKTLEHFWETMAFRQECSSGRSVGFIWIVFTPPDLHTAAEDDGADSQLSFATPPASQEMPSINENLSALSELPASPRKRHRRTKLTGPIKPRQPKIKASFSNISVTSNQESSPYYKWPAASRGQVVLDSTAYQRVHDLLLRLEFRDLNAAIESTQKWTEEVSMTTGATNDWGRTVEGQYRELETPSGASSGASSGQSVQQSPLHQTCADVHRQVNVLSVKRKRKPDAEAIQSSADDAHAVSTANVLNTGLIRKRPKVV